LLVNERHPTFILIKGKVMQGFIFEGDDTFPTVILNKRDGIFRIEGNSTPENGKEFFEPVINWLSEYAGKPNEETHFIFDLDYFNISSSKAFLFILYKLLEIQQAGKKVHVTWCYSDAYILGAGRDYGHMVKIPFEFKKVRSGKIKSDSISVSEEE